MASATNLTSILTSTVEKIDQDFAHCESIKFLKNVLEKGEDSVAKFISPVFAQDGNDGHEDPFKTDASSMLTSKSGHREMAKSLGDSFSSTLSSASSKSSSTNGSLQNMSLLLKKIDQLSIEEQEHHREQSHVQQLMEIIQKQVSASYVACSRVFKIYRI